MESELLTAEEVAVMLGCLRRRVCTLARAGRMVGVLAPKKYLGHGGRGTQWFFEPEVVAAYQRQERYGQRLVKTTVITANRDDLLWFAGFFDGEGCVSIQARSDRSGWHLHLILPNTARSIVSSIPALFGGSVFDVKQLPHQWKPQRRWRCSGRQAGLVLRALLPYLRVKRQQAALGIEFQDRIDRCSNNGHRPIPAEECAWREKAWERMQWLNHHDESG